MVKKFSLLVVALSALMTAFMILPQATMAAVRHDQQGNHIQYTNAYSAFVGVINNGVGSGTALAGSLSLQIDPFGAFKGTLNEPNNVQVPVAGHVVPSGQLNITFFVNPKQAMFILGQATLNSSNVYAGRFQEYSGPNKIASGIWSAQSVSDPHQVTAYNVTGQVTSGSDSGTVINAALVLNNTTATGSANLPDGTLAPVTTYRAGPQIEIVANLGSGGQIVGLGTVYNNNIVGTFTGPHSGDSGLWQAHHFGFGNNNNNNNDNHNHNNNNDNHNHNH